MILIPSLFLIFGMMIGSFVNVLIYRMPRLMPVSLPRSRCPSCNKIILWYELVPVFSYLFLGGKCSVCRTKISWVYPIVELSIGFFSGFYLSQLYLINFDFLQVLFFLFVFSSFVAIFVIDMKHKIIPDQLNLFLAIIFLVWGIKEGNWTTGLIGAAMGFALTMGVTWGYYYLRGKIGLGFGDIKFYGALGLYLGPVGIVQNITFSCFLGALIGGSLILLKLIKSDTHIPFGPFIVIVAMVQIFFPELFRLIAI